MSISFYWITNIAAILITILFLLTSWFFDRKVIQRLTTVNITLIAILCALSVVLTNVIGYLQVFGLQIMFGNFILFLIGMLFGPFIGVLMGVITDGIGALVFLGGTYHAGFMVEKIIYGFLGSAVFFWAGTNKLWQLKIILLMGLGIIFQLFVITPISLWSMGGVGYVIAGLIKKVIIFPIELVLYPFLTIVTLRIIWFLLVRIPNTSSTVWAARNGSLQFILKPKKMMIEELSKKEQKLLLKDDQKIVTEKEV